MQIRAVLFDVGGPLDTEVTAEAAIDAAILRAMNAVGVQTDAAGVTMASDWAVSVFAPDTYAAMVWKLSGEQPELAGRAYAKFREELGTRPGTELRRGIDLLVEGLHERGLLLGLAANQPARIIADLDGFGIGRYFQHREVSGHHGYRKPDVRLFLRACEDLGVEPGECIMVGDRIDNDVVPAKLLGMRTVLLRTGRHLRQQPRAANEVPDIEVTGVSAMADAIDWLLGPG